MYRAACSLVLALFVTLPIHAQKKDPPKEPEKITAKNIDIGKVGTIDDLKVIRADSDALYLIARFDGVKVLVNKYPKKVGVGKVLPDDQLWKVTSLIKRDTTGDGLVGAYVIEAVTQLEGKKPGYSH